MAKIKIGVVEDEIIIARSIISTIDELGYQHCGPSISYSEAVEMIGNHQPDLLLLDITLSGKKDGIDVAEWVNEHGQIPFIFLTAFSDSHTIDRAKKVKPNAYLVKPFTREELYAAIEIAISNFSSQKKWKAAGGAGNLLHKDAIFVKCNHLFLKIALADILYLESEHNYVQVMLTDKKKVLVRSGFSDFLQKLPTDSFLQVHRRYIINLKHIQAFDGTEVDMNGHKIPIGKTQLQVLMDRLGVN
jgi:DNA-binding LytR/AlgR family response regulator